MHFNFLVHFVVENRSRSETITIHLRDFFVFAFGTFLNGLAQTNTSAEATFSYEQSESKPLLKNKSRRKK